MSPPGPTQSRRGWDELAPVVLAFGVVTAIYGVNVALFLGKHPVPPEGSGGSRYYQRLAEGFAAGQLSFLERPPAALMRVPDPYDPAQRTAAGLEPLLIHDASVYDGRYYLPWGPFPAILLVPLEWLPPAARPRVEDWVLVLLFAPALLAGIAGVLYRVKRSYFPDTPRWLLPVLTLASGLLFPTTIAVGRPMVYEASIFSGQALLLTGLLCAFLAVGQGGSTGRMGLAGLCWGAALASRLTLLPSAGALVLCSLVWLWRARPRGRHREFLAPALALIVPVTGSGLLLLVYNQSRFGRALEFGLPYQMAGFNHMALRHHIQSISYVLPNAVRYLFQPPHFGWTFPFLRPSGGAAFIHRVFELPDYYNVDGVMSLPACASFLWLGSIPVRSLFHRSPEASPPLRLWLVPALIGGIVMGIPPMLTFFASIARYLLDFTPLAAVLAGIGAMEWLARAPEGSPARRRAAAVITGLAAASCLPGVLSGFACGTMVTGFGDFLLTLQALASRL